MITSSTKTNSEEFMVFMLLYASIADYEISVREIAMIKSKYDGLLVDNTLSKFEKMSDYERVDFIMKNKADYIKTDQDLEQMFEELNVQFESDGDYSKLEKGLSNFLKHLLIEEW